MLVFEENKPSCATIIEIRTICKRLDSFRSARGQKSLPFPELGLAVSVEEPLKVVFSRDVLDAQPR